MTFPPSTWDLVEAILAAPTTRMTELVRLVGLNPSTVFVGADLSNADFRNEDLSDYDLTNARLVQVDLRGANLSRTTGLTEANLQGAIYDETTRFPPALRAAMRARLARAKDPRDLGPAGRAPKWAETWGIDHNGPWVAFSVAAADGTRVEQRLRWCPPSDGFLMGSPPEEAGRYDYEGPQHEVTLKTGFWLFDTPCTQALWQAVMGDNPSEYKSPTRPVETVSYRDARKFLTAINKRVRGLKLTLPSESQWEYACRAGTITATYAGDLEILGDHHAPVLDDIAWYGGNSGSGFKLDNGYDVSDWADKQYDEKRAGTHPVGQKAANPFGLYDMLGNVWEWCADAWHDSYEDSPADGAARPGGGSAVRVIRGGSWYDPARYVRAACRNGRGPGDRSDDIGFRCARVHTESDSAAAERRAVRSRRQRAERGSGDEQPGAPPTR